MCSLLQLYNSILNNHTLYPALDIKLGIKKHFNITQINHKRPKAHTYFSPVILKTDRQNISHILKSPEKQTSIQYVLVNSNAI